MPTLTIETRLLDALGVPLTDLRQYQLGATAKRCLEALLMSRGFDIDRTIQVAELAKGDGFLLTQ
jgi:hypothetical protein